MARSAILNVMVQAAMKAGRSLSRDFGEVQNLQVSLKGPGDYVSQADRKAEDIIFAELSKARPGYGFLMEERGVVHRPSAGRARRSRGLCGAFRVTQKISRDPAGRQTGVPL